MTDRTPPQAVEAEQSTLGSMLMSAKAVAKVAAILRPEDFYMASHREIYAAMMRLREREVPVDPTLVAQELERVEQLEFCGGKHYLTAVLGNTISTSAHADYYAGKVLETAELRRMIDLGGDIIAACFSQAEPADAIRRSLISRLLATGRTDRRGPVRWGEALMTELERLCAREPEPALLSGITSLDRVTGGLGRGDLGIIAGRPGTGKSALMLQMMIHGARTWGKGVLVSLEMDAAANVRRALANATNFTYRELRDVVRWSGDWPTPMTDHDAEHVMRRAQTLEDLNDLLWIDDEVYELDDLIARVHSLHAQEGLGFVAVDYGQLVKGRPGDERNQEVEAVVQALKTRIAKSMRVPCWMLSSAGRGVESRGKGARLKKSDLMWSSSIEFTASTIILLNEDGEYYGTNGATGVIADVDKSRNDMTGEVPLVFHKARFMMTGRDEHHAGEEPPEYYKGGD